MTRISAWWTSACIGVTACGGATFVDPVTDGPPAGSLPDGGNAFTTEAGFPEGSCAAVCGDALGPGHPFTSSDDLAPTLRGRWLYCSGNPMGRFVNGFPTDVVGAEFTDVAVFWLVKGPDGQIVRGVGPDYVTAIMYTCTAGTTCADAYGHFGFEDNDFNGEISDCPRAMNIGYATTDRGAYIAIP